MFCKRKRRGFTLVEVLLVLAIIGVVTAITLPSFVKSIRGNRLRTAARVVVMMGRYTRSMALIKQREMALVFDLSSSRMSVQQVLSAPVVTTNSAIMEKSSADEFPADEAVTAINTNPVPEQAYTSFGKDEISRRLDGVRFEYIRVTGADMQTNIESVVIYKSNGTCVPYEVKIVDDRSAWVKICVDALSSATTEGGR